MITYENGKFNVPSNDYLQNSKWVKIPDFPKYLINTDGYIISLQATKRIFIKGSIAKSEYVIVSLCNEQGYVTKYLHQVMAYVFLEFNFSSNFVIDHINHVRWDNRIQNLRVCSKSENSKNRKPFKQLPPIFIDPAIKLTIGTLNEVKQDRCSEMITYENGTFNVPSIEYLERTKWTKILCFPKYL